MKNYIWFKADGSIGGESCMGGGFPAEADLDAAMVTDPLCIQIDATQRALNPELQGWIETNDCAHDVQNCYVSDPLGTPVLTARPTAVVKLNGTPTTANTKDTPLSYAPGTVITLTVEIAGIPDGTTIPLGKLGDAAVALGLPLTLTFTGGVSNTVNLAAPSQGALGGVGFYHMLWAKPVNVWLLGWS